MKNNKITGVGIIASIIGIVASIVVIVIENKTLGFILICSCFTNLCVCIKRQKRKK